MLAQPVTYHGGDYPAGQASVIKASGYDDFPARQAAARTAGRYIGIGLANYVEGTGLGPYEGATVRIMPNGKVAVATGATSQGQGTPTTLSPDRRRPSWLQDRGRSRDARRHRRHRDGCRRLCGCDEPDDLGARHY
jgi:hypothetical protein